VLSGLVLVGVGGLGGRICPRSRPARLTIFARGRGTAEMWCLAVLGLRDYVC